MLITVGQLVQFFGVLPAGVLHVGAHEAEEADEYKNYGWGHVTWVEMLPDKYAALRRRFADDAGMTVLNAACWDLDGVKLPVFRADNGQSSSLLRPDYHLTAHPSITFAEDPQITTSRLDTILPETSKFNFINFDIQGAELRALRGLGTRLADVKWAYLEVNDRRVYADCALIGEVDDFMRKAGFSRVATTMAHSTGNESYGWGDALYFRTQHMTTPALISLWARASAWKSYVVIDELRQNGIRAARALKRRLAGGKAKD